MAKFYADHPNLNLRQGIRNLNPIQVQDLIQGPIQAPPNLKTIRSLANLIELHLDLSFSRMLLDSGLAAEFLNPKIKNLSLIVGDALDSGLLKIGEICGAKLENFRFEVKFQNSKGKFAGKCWENFLRLCPNLRNLRIFQRPILNFGQFEFLNFWDRFERLAIDCSFYSEVFLFSFIRQICERRILNSVEIRREFEENSTERRKFDENSAEIRREFEENPVERRKFEENSPNLLTSDYEFCENSTERRKFGENSTERRKNRIILSFENFGDLKILKKIPDDLQNLLDFANFQLLIDEKNDDLIFY